MARSRVRAALAAAGTSWPYWLRLCRTQWETRKNFAAFALKFRVMNNQVPQKMWKEYWRKRLVWLTAWTSVPFSSYTGLNSHQVQLEPKTAGLLLRWKLLYKKWLKGLMSKRETRFSHRISQTVQTESSINSDQCIISRIITIKGPALHVCSCLRRA